MFVSTLAPGAGVIVMAAKPRREGEIADNRFRLAVVGSNPTKLWGISSAERIARMAEAIGLDFASEPEVARIIANSAFVFDRAWLGYIAGSPGTALTCAGRPVLAHVRDSGEAADVAGWMAGDARAAPPGLAIVPAESDVSLPDAQLRKRERPFVLVLTPDTIEAAERASYYGAYKGVTDLLTKYLWPEWALMLTRVAVRIGLSPNMVTMIGLLFCIVATYAFYLGHYWPGVAAGLVFMVLDTVDGKLARCTITSSWWGNIFDHGIDLVHPPIWWWAWAMGLAAYGTPLSPPVMVTALVAILVAYVVQRLIEGAFILSFGMHVHVWRPVDSQFRLITARRNPNMLILFAALCVGRPDLGLLALAWWSVLSCLFHLMRLAQAYLVRASGRPVISWLG